MTELNNVEKLIVQLIKTNQEIINALIKEEETNYNENFFNVSTNHIDSLLKEHITKLCDELNINILKILEAV